MTVAKSGVVFIVYNVGSGSRLMKNSMMKHRLGSGVYFQLPKGSIVYIYHCDITKIIIVANG